MTANKRFFYTVETVTVTEDSHWIAAVWHVVWVVWWVVWHRMNRFFLILSRSQRQDQLCSATDWSHKRIFLHRDQGVSSQL